MQLISQSETLKETLEFSAEQRWKEKTWKTRMSCLRFIGGKNSNKQQVEADCIENTQLHEDNQLEEKYPDVCDEELEEWKELFFSH